MVGQPDKHNANSRIGYLKATKQVVQYDEGIMYLGLTYNAFYLSEKETKTLVTLLPFELIG